MAKPLYVYTGSQWVPVASELESTSQYATTTYVDNKVGLVHINTTSFSAVASQSLNNVFSATYKNYRIITNITASGTPTLSFRWRVGGVDNSTASSYVTQYIFGQSTSVSGAIETAAQAIFGSTASATQRGNAYIDVSAPFETVPTAFLSTNQESGNSVVLRGGYHNQSTSYDGFTVIASTGTITGTIRVYGYKD